MIVTINVTCGPYYKPITIVNYDSRVINKFWISLTDDARVVIYDRHMFLVEATEGCTWKLFKNLIVAASAS